jgi:AmmeMemoRadiSam system protein A
MLTSSQRRILLAIARDSIRTAFARKPYDVTAAAGDPELTRPSGSFVTLNERGGELRGCIGSIVAVQPLHESVAANARAAAFRDPRFHPLTPEELDAVHIEISVLGPIEPVTDPQTIEVGRDGLIVSRGGNAGLLLPQVAVEWGWDQETFLAQTCVKAGLPPSAWRAPETRLEKFTAEVFGE